MSLEFKQELYDTLFGSYNPDLIPYHDTDATLNITVTLFIASIMSLSTINQMMYTNAALLLSWTDDRIGWEPSQYGNISSMFVPHSKLWLPDFTILNSGGSVYEDSEVLTNVKLNHDGSIGLLSKTIITSSCDINVSWYPYDRQTCSIQIGSWSYDSSDLLLIHKPVGLDNFSPNPEFYLEDAYGESRRLGKQSFYSVWFNIQLHRRTDIIFYFFILPACIINVCSVMVFLLPPSNGERIGLSTNTLLSMIVFLTTTTQSLPPSKSGLPFIGQFYVAGIIALTFNIICSITTVKLHDMHEVRMPRRVRALVSFIGRLFFLGPLEDLESNSVALQKVPLKLAKSSVAAAPPQRVAEAIQDDTTEYKYRSLVALDAVNTLLEDIIRRLSKGSIFGNQDTFEKQERINCRYLVRLLDRVFFVTFTLVNGLIIAWVMYGAPTRNSEFSYCPYGKGMCKESFDYTACSDALENGDGC